MVDGEQITFTNDEMNILVMALGELVVNKRLCVFNKRQKLFSVTCIDALKGKRIVRISQDDMLRIADKISVAAGLESVISDVKEVMNA